MIALIQRVKQAKVEVDGETVGAIGAGLLVLLGVQRGDDEAKADKLLHKVSHYRLFSDEQGKMNLDVQQVGGSLLVVSQFTLAAETERGLRPSFSNGADPALTTVAQPLDLLGRRAIALAQQMIAEEPLHAQPLLLPELVIRGSTSVPKA